jgi:hypothetical protein
LTSDCFGYTSTFQNLTSIASLNDSQEASTSEKRLHRLHEAIQVAKEVGEGLGASQVLQREVPQGWLTRTISLIDLISLAILNCFVSLLRLFE